MKCVFCKRDLEEGEKVCPYCGNIVNEVVKKGGVIAVILSLFGFKKWYDDKKNKK